VVFRSCEKHCLGKNRHKKPVHKIMQWVVLVTDRSSLKVCLV
jgi:hypothetical protein